jgi:hypothetical protein
MPLHFSVPKASFSASCEVVPFTCRSGAEIRGGGKAAVGVLHSRICQNRAIWAPVELCPDTKALVWVVHSCICQRRADVGHPLDRGLIARTLRKHCVFNRFRVAAMNLSLFCLARSEGMAETLSDCETSGRPTIRKERGPPPSQSGPFEGLLNTS